MASSAGYNKMFPVSWTELHRDARALAWRLADLGPFKGLVAITRGGLVPAWDRKHHRFTAPRAMILRTRAARVGQSDQLRPT